MDEREYVGRIYPDATCQPIYKYDGENIKYWCVYSHDRRESLGVGDTEQEAWENAMMTLTAY